MKTFDTLLGFPVVWVPHYHPEPSVHVYGDASFYWLNTRCGTHKLVVAGEYTIKARVTFWSDVYDE